MKKGNSVGIQIGVPPLSSSTENFTKALLRIIGSAGGDAVKLAAIEALKNQYSIGPVTISNSTVHV